MADLKVKNKAAPMVQHRKRQGLHCERENATMA